MILKKNILTILAAQSSISFIYQYIISSVSKDFLKGMDDKSYQFAYYTLFIQSMKKKSLEDCRFYMIEKIGELSEDQQQRVFSCLSRIHFFPHPFSCVVVHDVCKHFGYEQLD